MALVRCGFFPNLTKYRACLKGQTARVYVIIRDGTTKGTMSTMRVRDNENTQTACTRRFFDEISTRLTDDRGKYGVVTNYGELLDLVRRAV